MAQEEGDDWDDDDDDWDDGDGDWLYMQEGRGHEWIQEILDRESFYAAVDRQAKNVVYISKCWDCVTKYIGDTVENLRSAGYKVDAGRFVIAKWGERGKMWRKCETQMDTPSPLPRPNAKVVSEEKSETATPHDGDLNWVSIEKKLRKEMNEEIERQVALKFSATEPVRNIHDRSWESERKWKE